jgi:2-dehydropantoate 2-reductase
MQGGLVVEPGIEVLTDPVVAPSVDWALVCTKTYDAGAAGRWLERLCGGGGRAAILQNGVEHRERFAGIVLPERLVPVIVDCPAERDSPTQVRQCGPGRMTVADDAGGRAFAALFSGSTADVVTTPDLKTAAWRKLCINAAGVVSALTLKPNGVMRDEAIGEVVRGIVREVIAVGRAEGAVLDEQLVEDVLAGGRRAPAEGVNSILADRLAGRRTEIDARNGVVVRLGREHGIATPCNAMAVALIEAQS